MAFTLHIFESEFKEIEDFVSRYSNIETGGDLFGLWKANGDPVVQLIIGPGQNCRRTSVSFHQDTNYLARVGTYVNSSFMLCHIGSWHSHHQLSLTQPSAGDRSTVCNNFPEGLKRYIMIIANITRGMSSRQSVVIHPYMFSKGGHVCQPGNVKKISLGSPFRELGYVMTCITKGAEQHVSAEQAYSSRAPLEFHNRPSTRSKPITGDIGMTNRESRSTHPNTQADPMHQNYFSVNGTSDHHSPMDVDPPENDRGTYHHSRYQVAGNNYTNHQRKTSPTRRVLNEDTNHGATQWYDTEEGGTLLKDITREMTTTMTSDINYYRDQNSKDLTMEFTHYGQKWSINFPKSFDNEPARISNSSYGKDVPSKSIAKDIRKACGCRQCQNNKHIEHSPSSKDHHPSPPKQDHSYSHAKPSPPTSPPKRDSPPPLKHVRQTLYSRQGHHSPHDKRPQSRKELKSPLPPWYNASSGKAIVEEIKINIESYLKAINKVGRVRTMETTSSKGRNKQLIFYHNDQDWIIEFFSSSKDVELKSEKYGQKKFVAKLKSPYDVVRALIQNCYCMKCRSMRSPSAVHRRQGSASTRPNSRYGANVDRRSPSRVSSTPGFFASDRGEEKFKKICTDISTLLLNGGNVDMSRHPDSKDIDVTFKHNRRQWKVTFPFEFPKEPLALHHDYAYDFRTVPLVDGNVLRAIKKNCDCPSCKWYH